MRRFLKFLPICLLLLSSVFINESCQRRELYYERPDVDYANIEVNLKWAKSGLTPEYATLLFYREGDKKPIIHYTTLSTDIVRLPVGNYSIIVINEKPEDFDAIGFRDMDSYTTIQAYAKHIDVKGGDMASAIAIESVDKLAVSTLKSFAVTKEMVTRTVDAMMSKSKNSTTRSVESLTFEPNLVTIHAEMIVRIKGINNIRKETSRGSLSGFAESIYLHSGKATNIPGICYFDLTKFTLDEGSTTVGSASGEVDIFGFRTAEVENVLTFSYDALLRDVDKTPYHEYRNVTSFVNQKPDATVTLYIEIGANVETDPKNPIIVVPDVKPEDSGFAPSIPDWDDEEIIDKVL